MTWLVDLLPDAPLTPGQSWLLLFVLLFLVVVPTVWVLIWVDERIDRMSGGQLRAERQAELDDAATSEDAARLREARRRIDHDVWTTDGRVVR